jgi:hypothetical protein
VNGAPGARALTPGGQPRAVFCLEIDGDRIVHIYNQLNPDKLGQAA